jgi:hypothetical protein
MAKIVGFLGSLAALAGVAPAAHACSIVADHQPSYWERRDEAKRAVARADAILDGEVVEAGVDGGAPAKIRVHRIFKGAVGDFVYIYGDSGACEMPFDRAGERSRILLYGTPDHFVSSIVPPDDRALDRILKSDRRKDWPFNPGRAE